MLSTRKTRVFVCKQPTDMRAGFDALYNRAKNIIGVDPKSGHMFLFINKKRDRVKVLLYDGTGYIVIAKRLDRGSFAKINPYYRKQLVLTQAEFQLYFEGADVSKRFIESP